MRHQIEYRKANRDRRARRLGTDAVDHVAHEASAVSRVPRNGPDVVGAEQLVAEIAVTVLDVDETESSSTQDWPPRNRP